MGPYLQAILAAYLDTGARLETLAAECGVDITWLCQPPARVAPADYLELMARAISISEDACFGLRVGRHMQATSFDILGEAMLKAGNLGQATRQVIALEGLVHTLGYSQVLKEGAHLRYVWHCHYQLHPLANHLSASVLAGIIHFSQRLAGRPMPVLDVTFVHDAPGETARAEYRRVCHGNCLFGQPYNSILVAGDVLDWPVNPDGAGEIAQLPLSGVRSPTAIRSTALWSRNLALYLEQNLALGSSSLTAVSRHYNVSERTLQRRLAQEGSSFQGLLNTVRHRVACDYLRYSSLSILEISELLGFREQSSFNHFFLAQQGQSPGSFRNSR